LIPKYKDKIPRQIPIALTTGELLAFKDMPLTEKIDWDNSILSGLEGIMHRNKNLAHNVHNLSNCPIRDISAL